MSKEVNVARTMKTFSLIRLLLLTVGIIGLAFLAMPAFAQDAGKVQELQRVIDAQQRQNEDQQKQMEAQQKQLDAQRQLLQDLQKQMESLVKDADKKEVPVAAETPAAKPAVASTKAPPPVEKVVTSGGGERVKLAISGWVNQMVNIVHRRRRQRHQGLLRRQRQRRKSRQLCRHRQGHR